MGKPFNSRVGTATLEELDSIHARHIDVRDSQIVAPVDEFCPGLLPIRCIIDDLEVFHLLKHFLEDRAHESMVLHHQYVQRSAHFFPSAGQGMSNPRQDRKK